MPLAIRTLTHPVAVAPRAVGVVVRAAHAYARFYFGYWFSHWRA